MDKRNPKTPPIHNTEQTLGNGAVEIGGYLYPVFLAKRSSTCTIYNPTVISDDDWHAVATGLTDVCEWKLQERTGKDFYYAYVAAPTTYMSSVGSAIQRSTEISAVYVKRVNAETLTMELEVWSN